MSVCVCVCVHVCVNMVCTPQVYYAANGTYSAFIFTHYIEQVIAQHDVSKPLFVYLPYQSVHGPLEVPQYYIDR